MGSYQLDANSNVKWLCFDLDPEKLADPTATAKCLLKTIKQNIAADTYILEASRYPDTSYHIWALFQEPVKAKVARWLGTRTLEMANLSPKEIEVFPKQNEVTRERPYGNFVKLPFGKHQVEQKWSRLLNTETFQPEPLEKLAEKHGLTFTNSELKQIEALADNPTKQHRIKIPKNFKPLERWDEDQSIEFLAKYWVNGYRNDLVISYCGHCIKKGIDHESCRRVIQKVCELTGTPSLDTSEFLSKVDYQYKNRIAICNLKGLSGINEVVEAVNAKAGGV